jgi:tight adherence protein C
MNALEIVLIIAIALSLSTATLVAIAVSPRRRQLIDRLRQYQDLGGYVDEPEDNLKKGLWDRFINPWLEGIGERLKFGSKEATMARLETQLELAGNPMGLTPGGLIALQLLGVFAGAVLSYLLGSFVLALEAGQLIVFIIASTILGLYVPRLWLGRAIAARRLEILEAMPNALDLLTLSVEAGLAFDASLARVAEKYQNALAEEFALVLAEMKLGRTRRDALNAMSDRLNIEDVTAFVTAIVQSTELGTNLGATLRIQAVDMRRRRRQRAEEKGNQAPLKMLLPMVGCIFPSLFVVLLGPAAIQLVHQFGNH